MKYIEMTEKALKALIMVICLAVCSNMSAADDLLMAGEDSFSIIWFSDTQSVAEKPNSAAYIPDWFRWIGDSRGMMNTVAVVHTGDLVENGWNPVYWERMNKGIDLIPDDIPFIASAGNHDVAKRDYDYTPWLAQPFVKRYLPQHTFNGGEGYYALPESNGTKLVIVAIGYNSITDEGLKWMRSVFDKYPDHFGIIVAHSVLSYNKSDRSSSIYTASGKRIMDEVTALCPNVRIVLCGHVAGMSMKSEKYEDTDGNERNVYVLRYNYQDCSQLNRIGFLRVLKFTPMDDKVEIITYSPILDRYHNKGDDPKKEHFVLNGIFEAAS